MTTQLHKDCQTLSEFIEAGPSRRDQLTADVYEIYRRYGYDPKIHKPEDVLTWLAVNPRPDAKREWEKAKYKYN